MLHQPLISASSIEVVRRNGGSEDVIYVSKRNKPNFSLCCHAVSCVFKCEVVSSACIYIHGRYSTICMHG